MRQLITAFLSGTSMAMFFVAALFFARFWQRTKDRLFGGFAAVFVLLAVERIAILATWHMDETRSWVYMIRLTAFLLLIFTIVDKNRASSRRRD